MGVRVSLIPDGDIYGIIATTSFGNGADLYIGYGGAPEGVLAGAVIKACNGFMMGKLHYTTNEQKERAVQYGLSNPNQILTLKDIVSKNCIFVASGVTNGEMLKGAKFCKKRGMNRVETIVFKSIEGIPFVSKSINYTKP
jgi:fructose-1,6-bisphosphatase II / sedoheptulose-1,7-bisphosphatase